MSYEIFPGYLLAVKQLGATAVEPNGFVQNHLVIKRLLVPLLTKHLKINKKFVLENYPEIQRLYRDGEVVNISLHMRRNAYFDGCISVPFDFDEEFYVSANPDVRAAVEGGVSSAREHYLKWGYLEGRLPAPSVKYLNIGHLL